MKKRTKRKYLWEIKPPYKSKVNVEIRFHRNNAYEVKLVAKMSDFKEPFMKLMEKFLLTLFLIPLYL